ncbi:hypothetical protein DdX_02997 [Ditylenchus destructor]|uniref:Uncharacterized protein n=1 Tax=Ditylenchus destructor TaxID=166010 RepID=A0AAD4R9L9_9BILA|nr:hypothetical protein DdX_02997 [Ditylenchus destructor]
MAIRSSAFALGAKARPGPSVCPSQAHNNKNKNMLAVERPDNMSPSIQPFERICEPSKLSSVPKEVNNINVGSSPRQRTFLY